MSRTRHTAAATVMAALALLAGGCGGGGKDSGTGPPIITPPAERPALPQTYRPAGRGVAGDVFVHLFEWKWTDIARECETVLGPAGYAAVQVSPPMEHSVQSSHTWSQRYQPVSYSVARSRSGTGAQFADMITRCRAVGVGIYVDAVINHMTNVPSPGIGSNGTAYTKYNYPGLFTEADFHQPCALNDYQSAANVQDCELFGLPDLHTGLVSVRQKIADYLIALARLGVAGFRIDAAKHMQPVELDDILDRMNQTLTSEGRPIPYVFGEVVGGEGEAVTKQDYYGLGYSSGGAADLTEFKVKGVGDKFMGVGGQRIWQLNPNGPAGSQFSALAWGLLPSDKAVIFLENHDTQRDGGISYRDGMAFRLANVWMLAQPYGYPSIMSSYAFDRGPVGRERGPPSDGNGNTSDVTCASSFDVAIIGTWVCEHRDQYIARMVGFRRVVAGTDINRWWDNGANAIAFSRGDRGFVAISREPAAITATIGTGLAAGTYCDLLTGGRTGSACAGTTITIDAAGAIQLTLQPNMAIVIHTGTRL